MTNQDAAKSIELLTELFPQADLQAGEMEVFRDAFLPFDFAAAQKAIREHRVACPYNRPKFNEIVIALKMSGGLENGSSQYERTRQMLDKESRSERELKDYWLAAETALESMPDDEVEIYREMALLSLKPAIRDFYAKRDPRKSRPMMGLIFDLMRKGVAA